MYSKYYGLAKNPFSLTPDPAAVFMSETHQEGLAILQYGVLTKKTFLVLTGDVGSGKTTLLQLLVDSLQPGVHICLLNNPILTRTEFFFFIAKKLGLEWDGNKARFLIEFGLLLKRCFDNGEQVLLIVDEAHVLPVDLLEEMRLLSNLGKQGQDVLSIFLVGQPELNERMNDDRLLPLRQRIGIRFHLNRFNLEETRQYILFRLHTAGARSPNIFSDEAIAIIYKASQGTPLHINIICDHALLTGFTENRSVVCEKLIQESINDLHFPGKDNPLPVAKPAMPKDRGPAMLYGSIAVVICFVFLLLEVLPMTRRFSLLGKVLPESWLQYLHF